MPSPQCKCGHAGAYLVKDRVLGDLCGKCGLILPSFAPKEDLATSIDKRDMPSPCNRPANMSWPWPNVGLGFLETFGTYFSTIRGLAGKGVYMVMPCLDVEENTTVRFYSARLMHPISGDPPRYKYPFGVHKYPWYSPGFLGAVSKGETPVLCEGVGDAAAVAAYQPSVALLGLHSTPELREMLKGTKVKILFDSDIAGIAGCFSLQRVLCSAGVASSGIFLPAGEDPAACSLQVLRDLLSEELTYTPALD